MGSPTSVSTGVLAVGTTVITNGHDFVNSLELVSDGTNAATMTVYDNTAGSGKILSILTVGATSVPAVFFNYSRALRCELGLTVVIAGTGAQGFVNHGAT